MDNILLAETLAETLEQIAATVPEPVTEKVAGAEVLDSEHVLGFLKFFCCKEQTSHG
jgi:hypothetical protein